MGISLTYLRIVTTRKHDKKIFEDKKTTVHTLSNEIWVQEFIDKTFVSSIKVEVPEEYQPFNFEEICLK